MWEAVLSLAKRCTMSPPTETLRKQRARAQKALFPCGSRQYSGWTVGVWKTPTPQAIAAMLAPRASTLLWHPRVADFSVANVAVWCEWWTTDVLAAAFGLSAEGLASAASDKAEEAKRSEQP